MCSKTVSVLVLFMVLSVCHALSIDNENYIEARGKKKKIALFVYFADLIVKKIFILKLIYAFVFWVVLHKAGYFLGWFASYLKEKKQEFHHDDHHHYDYRPSHGYGPSHDYGPSHGYGSSHSYGPSYDSYGPSRDSNGPYKRYNQRK